MLGESHAEIKKKATILLLSSDQIVRLVLKDVLEAHGYVVLPANDLARAVDWCSRCAPDLLIVSPYLSCITGHEAALYLRTRCHGIRILMTGGFLDDDRLRYRATLQLIDVFPKPFTAAEFITKVSDVLAAPAGKIA